MSSPRSPTPIVPAMTADYPLVPSRFARGLYAVARQLLWWIARVAFRVHRTGLENVPHDGAFIAAFNHRSNLDTPIAGSALVRRVRFMGKAVLFSKPWSSKFFITMGAFPVDREGNPSAALRAALKLAEAGESLAMFPEGRRHAGNEIGELQDGLAFIAVRYQIPIVPVGVAGTEKVLPPNAKFPKFTKVAVVIGPPIIPPVVKDRADRRTAVAAVNAELRVELQRVFDDARAELT